MIDQQDLANYALVAFALSVVALVVAVPASVALVRAHQRLPPDVIVMVALVILSLALGGVVGSLGRLLDSNPFADQWVRVGIIALRVFAIGGLANIWWRLRST